MGHWLGLRPVRLKSGGFVLVISPELATCILAVIWGASRWCSCFGYFCTVGFKQEGRVCFGGGPILVVPEACLSFGSCIVLVVLSLDQPGL